jgi:hypothetical protein
MPGLAAIMTYLTAIFGRPAPRPALGGWLAYPSGDAQDCDAQLRASRTAGRRLDRLTKVLRIAIDDLYVDSRHDVLRACADER